MKHLYSARSAGLGKIFCNFRENPILFSWTHFLNVQQILTYYTTLIINVFAMMPEKHCYS